MAPTPATTPPPLPPTPPMPDNNDGGRGGGGGGAGRLGMPPPLPGSCDGGHGRHIKFCGRPTGVTVLPGLADDGPAGGGGLSHESMGSVGPTDPIAATSFGDAPPSRRAHTSLVIRLSRSESEYDPSVAVAGPLPFGPFGCRTVGPSVERTAAEAAEAAEAASTGANRTASVRAVLPCESITEVSAPASISAWTIATARACTRPTAAAPRLVPACPSLASRSKQSSTDPSLRMPRAGGRVSGWACARVRE